MFKKKPNIKTLNLLRSSDRRKIADRIIADLSLGPRTAEEGDEEAPTEATSARSALRKSLLPDITLSAKFTTTSGPSLKEVAGTVYVGSHGSGEQRVLWVKIEEVLYPTVYTLWHNPRILPLLHTPSLVVDKLKGGADLMTPGLAGPPFPPTARKGALVAVASLDSPSVPVVVGTCAIDISSLKTTAGAKGHAVETFHWAGDDLWDWSASGRSGASSPIEIAGWLAEPEDRLAKATEGLAISEEDEGGVALPATTEKSAPEPPHPQHNGYLSGEDATPQSSKAPEGDGMSVKEIDDIFWQAFLYGVHEQRKLHSREPKYGLTFPIHQSYFMSHLVLPFLPTFTSEQAQSLQIKKTTWKNARKFIKALDKDKLLLCKEQKNEASVLDIDFEDAKLTSFKPYRLPRKESAETSNIDTAPTNDTHDDSIGQQLKVSTLYRPKDTLAPLFRIPSALKLSWYSAFDIRSAVTAYIESSDLVMPTNKRSVKLDPVLSNAVLSPEATLDRELLAKGTIPRDVLIDRVVSLCAPFHSILRNGETVDDPKAKPKAGVAPKIGILLETRGGNKTVTRVFGFEVYFIGAQSLADELRKGCASSTSVEPFKGGKGMEVMVQGPQKDAVVKSLEKRGVLKAWIEVSDKTKGGKKK